jgi:coenzyme F420-dependent glucose-6-phosphate dehydrogenase
VRVAQAFATLEEMFPGRAFVGIGSGEALNETPTGADWPDPEVQVARMAEALEIMSRLFDGERLDFEGEHFTTRGAYLHTRGERRPPIWVSAFGPEAAKVAAKWVEQMGATIVVLMNITGENPNAAIRTYGGKVLPAVRGES